MSTIRVNAIQNTSTTDGGISINNSGHVTVDGVAMPSAGPLSNRNLIINGAMQVAQRGTSQASVSDGSNEGYTTVDRFPFYFSSGTGGAATLSQSTDVPSNQGFSSSYKADVTTTATLSAGNTIIMQYLVEAQDLRNSGWNYTDTSSFITLSFWAKSSKSGTHCVFFDMEDGTNNQHRNEEYTLTANTWEKITINLPGHANHVVNNDTGRGLNIQWLLASSASATSGSWVDSGDRGTSNQVNVFDSTDGEFFLTGVQLEVGSVATPFEHRSYGDELARCRRYYQRFTATSPSTATATCSAFMYTSTAVIGVFQSQVQMRAIPTLDSSSGTNHYGIFRNGTYDSFNSVSISSTCSENCFVFANTTEVSGTAGQAGWLFLDISTAYLGFSAEL